MTMTITQTVATPYLPPTEHPRGLTFKEIQEEVGIYKPSNTSNDCFIWVTEVGKPLIYSRNGMITIIPEKNAWDAYTFVKLIDPLVEIKITAINAL